MSNQVTKNDRQNQIQRAFLYECSKTRLDVIVGEGNSNKLLSDFITLAEQYPNAPLEQLAKCCVEIASLKLPIHKQSGQAYIVPRGGVYNVEIGYKGWLVLAERVGILVRAYPIFKDDDYSFEVEDFEQKFTFKPNPQNASIDKTNDFIEKNLLFIAVTTKSLKTGVVNVDLVDFSTLKRMQSKSSGGSTTYKDWYLEMLRAKAIKYVLRKMPIDTMDSTIFRAFISDDVNDASYSEQSPAITQTSEQRSNPYASAMVQQPAPQSEIIDAQFGDETIPSINIENL